MQALLEQRGEEGLMPGQLDEISQAIGRLSGQFETIERYMHDREHGLNNLTQKIEALGIRITRDIAAVEGRIEGRIKAMDDRLIALEIQNQREAGARNLAASTIRTAPTLITLLTGLVVVIVVLVANGRL